MGQSHHDESTTQNGEKPPGTSSMGSTDTPPTGVHKIIHRLGPSTGLDTETHKEDSTVRIPAQRDGPAQDSTMTFDNHTKEHTTALPITVFGGDFQATTPTTPTPWKDITGLPNPKPSGLAERLPQLFLLDGEGPMLFDEDEDGLGLFIAEPSEHAAVEGHQDGGVAHIQTADKQIENENSATIDPPTVTAFEEATESCDRKKAKEDEGSRIEEHTSVNIESDQSVHVHGARVPSWVREQGESRDNVVGPLFDRS
jgi:hypothetical protein